MNKILELFTTRQGKLSPYKVAWLSTLFSMLYVIISESITQGKPLEIPSTWVGFLSVAGGTSLGRSYLANKKEEKTQIPPITS